MLRWTRQEIIRSILRREAAGLPLSLGGEAPVDQSLYQAASRVFGTWRNAVMAAGISPDKARSHESWRPARILAEIRALARRRRPLRPNELKREHGSLMRAARRMFGSWSAAIIVAGADPVRLRTFPPWTKERIIEAILTRALRNESLRSHSVRPKSLSSAGIRIFGSWGRALAAAGLDPERYRQPGLDESQVCMAPRAARHAKAPFPIHEEGKAVRGPSPYPTDESVLNAIRTRINERQPNSAMPVYRENLPLYRAARRLFGSWRNALAAAGLDPRDSRASRWSNPSS